MELRLEVTRYQGLSPAQPAVLRLSGGACTLGRNTDNDLPLEDPEPMVSGRPARLHARPPPTSLSDLSTNGTFLNWSPERLPPNQPVALHDGDMLSIGPYEIAVCIDVDEPWAATDLFAHDEAALPGMQSPGAGPNIMDLLGGGGHPAGNDRGPAEDPFADAHLMDPFLTGPAAVVESPRAAEPRQTPVEHVFFRPPETQAIPEDYDLLNDALPTPESAPAWEPIPKPEPMPTTDVGPQLPLLAKSAPLPGSDLDLSLDPDLDERAVPPIISTPDLPGSRAEPRTEPPAPGAETVEPLVLKPAPGRRSPASLAPQFVPAMQAPPPRSGPPPAVGEPLAAFFAGLDTGDPGQVKDPDALLHDAGALLRVLTAGLTDTMMTRASFKSELRLGVTTIRRTENNPFKFSVSPEEALERLLLRPNPGYLAPRDAAREAFEDIQAHEMAMIAGLRAALRALLARFEPSALEARLQAASGLDKLLPMARKSRYWDQFTLTYGQVAADATEDFMQLFGEAFARAYEDQVLRLAQARGRRPPG